MPEHIHVSVAWPYANGDLHAGHLAGAYLPADIFARFHRLKGNHVLMVSGSDAHGTPITVEADRLGLSPRAVFEHYHHRFLVTQQRIGISYDLFTHTDTENHHRVAQDIFLRLLERSYLYTETQRLLYSETERRFLPDRYVEGTCPICGYADARGDQCDNCGSLLDAVDLINPRSKTDGSTPVIRETEHYFLNLPAFIDELRAYLNDPLKAQTWRPNVLRVSQNKVEDLKGRPITRDIAWGIPVPLEGWEDKCMYVWFEAVMGYFTASVEWARNIGQPDAWKRWWYNPDARIYNFIGKDNIEFHTIIWPAELLGIDGLYAAEDDGPISLPYDVPANEFMNIEGQQFSKSRNWAIWVPDILDRYDPDAIRYYIAMTFPESRDSDWSWDGFVTRNNTELLAAWGNLVNRVLKFAHKHFGGAVPDPGALRAMDEEIIARVEGGFATVGGLLAAVRLRDALTEGIALAREVNGYLDRAPWFKVVAEDKAAAATTIYTALRCIDSLKTLLAPFLPFTSQRVHEYLGYDGTLFGEQRIEVFQESERPHEALTYHADERVIGRWEPSALPIGQALREPEPLFRKLEPTLVDEERARLGQPREAETQPARDS
ncbi:MAG: methionine--tRNA ligase [Anaerolineae bacterium]|nr:methionine--tRNA ligase [Anaerolineae bacterium]